MSVRPAQLALAAVVTIALAAGLVLASLALVELLTLAPPRIR